MWMNAASIPICTVNTGMPPVVSRCSARLAVENINAVVLLPLKWRIKSLRRYSMAKSDRFKILREIAQHQLHVLAEAEKIKELPDVDGSK